MLLIEAYRVSIRVRISSCGIADVLTYEVRPDLTYMQVCKLFVRLRIAC